MGKASTTGWWASASPPRSRRTSEVVAEVSAVLQLPNGMTRTTIKLPEKKLSLRPKGCQGHSKPRSRAPQGCSVRRSRPKRIALKRHVTSPESRQPWEHKWAPKSAAGCFSWVSEVVLPRRPVLWRKRCPSRRFLRGPKSQARSEDLSPPEGLDFPKSLVATAATGGKLRCLADD